MRIGIIGAGHAGVEAAGRASSRGAEAVLFSKESVLPYYRPRVVALAFGQVEPDAIHIKPADWYEKNGIDLRLDCPVTHLDVQERTVVAREQQEVFDALVLATGATPVVLPLARDFPEDAIALWDVERSLAIRDKLGAARRLVVLGGGISGVEAALYAVDAGLEVTVVEKANCLMPMQSGPNAAAVLANRLREKGIRLLLGRCAESISREPHGLKIALNDSEAVPCDLVVTTVGARRELAIFKRAGLRTDKGVLVDDCLRTSAPGVFACGDVAQRNGTRTASVMNAVQQGRGAGANAVASLQGQELEAVPAAVVPLSLKHGDIELYAAGPPQGEGLEERTLSEREASAYRSVLLQDGILRGVQMVGTREGFHQLVAEIGRPWRPAQG